MNPIQLFDPASSTYTYVLFDETTREALIIDPVDEQIEREKIASNERIAFVKIASERKIAEYRASLTAQQTQAPTGYQNA